MTLTAPAPIESKHDLSEFQSGRSSLDEWLKKRALKNQKDDASRTYVVCEGVRVIAYYCLAAGAVHHADAPPRVKRNMPDPIPVMVLGRLAADASVQGQGIGRALVRDAALRTLNASEHVGIRALLVHALDEPAAGFYKRLGFLQSPVDPLVLMLPLATARAAINRQGRP